MRKNLKIAQEVILRIFFSNYVSFKIIAAISFILSNKLKIIFELFFFHVIPTSPVQIERLSCKILQDNSFLQDSCKILQDNLRSRPGIG